MLRQERFIFEKEIDAGGGQGQVDQLEQQVDVAVFVHLHTGSLPRAAGAAARIMLDVFGICPHLPAAAGKAEAFSTGIIIQHYRRKKQAQTLKWERRSWRQPGTALHILE